MVVNDMPEICSWCGTEFTGWSRFYYLRFVHILKHRWRHVCETLQPKTISINQLFQYQPLTLKIIFALSLSVDSSGESTGVCFVNFESNCDVSSSLLWKQNNYNIFKSVHFHSFPTKIGLNGGSSLRIKTSSQLMCLKNWCALTAAASSGAAPKRLATCLFKSFLTKSLASAVKYGGKFNLPLRIFSIVFFRFSAVNGGLKKTKTNQLVCLLFFFRLTAPVNISYIKAPNDHQSTSFPWPLLVKISGALKIVCLSKQNNHQGRLIVYIYSIVPQNVCVTMPSWMCSLHKPKSVSLTCPCASNKMFSGFKSR